MKKASKKRKFTVSHPCFVEGMDIGKGVAVSEHMPSNSCLTKKKKEKH